MSATQSICLVAGEPSGDLHGALLVAELKRRHPDWACWGVGSEKMAEAGCDLWRDAREWSVMGFSHVVRSLPQFHERLKGLTGEIARRRPDRVILIDYPGFNLKLAPKVHALGIPVMYYIVPQLWAWGTGRIKIFKRYIDKTVVVFPFEKEFFLSHDVPCEWIGHPLVDHVRASASRDELRARLKIGAGEKMVAILPGSRLQDFESHLPLFTQAVKLIGDRVAGIRWALGLAPSLSDTVAPLLNRPDRAAVPVTTAIYDLIAAADVVLTKTGTATVECALLGTPMVTVYRTGWLNYLIARRLVKVPFIAMPNLIAGKRLVPELIQNQATPDAVAREAVEILSDTNVTESQRAGLAEVRQRLGPPGAVSRAVGLVEQWLA
jgi:lipid-A-disaccharide synthase